MLNFTFLNMTTVRVHWEVIIPILSVALIIIIIRALIIFTFNKRLKSYIATKNYNKAFETSKKLYKMMLTNTLNADLIKLTTALLSLYYENKQDFLVILSKITNKELDMIKNYWKSIFAFASNDYEEARLYFQNFENSFKPTNKTLINYETCKNNLLIIQRYCNNKTDETLKDMQNIIHNNSFSSDLITKLFLIN